MKHMLISAIFVCASLWVFFPGARMIAAEKYFISGLIIKVSGSFLLMIAGLFIVLGVTAE